MATRMIVERSDVIKNVSFRQLACFIEEFLNVVLVGRPSRLVEQAALFREAYELSGLYWCIEVNLSVPCSTIIRRSGQSKLTKWTISRNTHDKT